MEGYFLAASLAALSAGLLPQQPMTRVEITGYSRVSRTTAKFGRTQLDALALAGVFIVTQNSNDGKIYTRHAVTTGEYTDVNQREESVTRDIDYVSYFLRDTLDPFIGIYTINGGILSRINATLDVALDQLSGGFGTVTTAGPAILSYTDLTIVPDALIKDKLNVSVNITVPYALNVIALTLVV
jgi:hypothetical protein